MQILNSSQDASSYVRRETMVSGGLTDGNKQAPNSMSATDQLVTKLAENIPGMSLSKMKALDANDYAPEKVASRISDFVAQGLASARARGASEERLQQMYDAAVSGVEKGFKEATEILDDLGMLSENTLATIEQTKDLTFDALAGLAPILNETAPSRQVSLSAAERFSKSEAFSLTVMTKEGDQVNIKFASSASETGSAGYYSEDDSSALAYSLDRSASSHYQFSVQGDLNEGELEALQTLIQDISLIADDFFSGDVQQAFAQATEFEMDKSQLMNLNVTMSRSASYSAVSAYQDVQQLENPLGDNGRYLGQLANNMEHFLDSSLLAERLKGFYSFAEELLANLVRQDVRYKEADESTQNKFEVNISLLADIASGFSKNDADD